MEDQSLYTALIEVLSYPFMQNALWASFFSCVTCGVIGTLVTHNRLTFLAGGASHAAYGGIGLAFHFSWPVLPCTVLFSLLASLLMGVIALQGEQKRGRFPGSSDAAIGVLWAVGMAFGIILIELTPGYAGELMGFLFGSILAVPQGDLAAMALFDLLLLVLLFFARRGIWAISLDREFAVTRGLPVRSLFLLLVGMTAVSVVMLIRIVGLILVLALLTIPSSLACGLCRSFYCSMAVASFFSLFFCLAGLGISWHTDISSGAAIIAVAAVIYFAAQLPRLHKK